MNRIFDLFDPLNHLHHSFIIIIIIGIKNIRVLNTTIFRTSIVLVLVVSVSYRTVHYFQ